ncbi:MAG: protein kinase [Myxococcota bacterium]
MESKQRTTSDLRTVTILGRLLATRFVSVFLLLLAVDVAVVVQAGQGTLELIRAADVGLLLRPGRFVDALDQRWPDVKRGDEVVAWQGEEVADGFALVSRRLEQQPGPLRLTFQRDGQRFEREAQATPLSTLNATAVVGRWVTASLILLIGLVLFALLPGTRTSWLFFAFTQTLGLFLLALPAFLRNTTLTLEVSAVAGSLAPATLAHFLTLFPTPLPGRVRLRLWLIYTPSVAVSLPILVISTRWGSDWSATLAVLQVFGSLWPSALVLSFIYRHLGLARSTGDRVALARTRMLALGLVLGLLLPLVVDLVRRVLGLGRTPWSPFFNGAPIILFVAVTAWVSVKHNAFDIDRFTSAVVGYGATLAVLLGAGAAVLLGLPLVLGPQLGGSPTVTVVITAAGFAVALPLYGRLKKKVDELFYRRQADAGTLASLLHKLSVAVQSRPPEETLRLGLETALSLGVERAELWRVSDTGEVLQRLRHEGVASTTQASELSRQGALAQALSHGAGGVAGLSEVVLPPAAQPELWGLELALAAPVQAHGALAGFVGVSRKRSGLGFTRDECTFLEAVASQVGLVLERSTGERLKFGRYRIERRLGVGGMAEVHLAWRLGPGGFERKVALKRPLPQLADDEVAVGMFLDEARIAAQLSHANIVQVYEVDRVENMVFMALEYVDGPSLREVLKRARALGEPAPPAVAVRVVMEVLSALDHAHRCRDANGRPLELIHRDVNPNNVLLTQDGRVKLTDFGIARAATRIAQTQTGIVKGTLPYMAPEQARGEVLDGRADLFPVAAMLYELLTLQRAFPEGPLASSPPPIHQVRADLPRPVLDVIAKGMAMERTSRFATADEFRDALLVASASLGRVSEADVADWLASLPQVSAPHPLPPPPAPDEATRTSALTPPR